MKKIMSMLLTGVLAAALLAGCASPAAPAAQKSEAAKTRITIKLDHDYRTDDIGRYLAGKYPDVELDLMVGRSGVAYVQKQAENNDLPDIMISSGTWGRGGQQLNQYLYDFSTTDIAGNFYSVYLDNYTASDGSVYWLPGCSAIEGVMANKTLFDEHGIALPTDYASFVEACNQFTELGIRPYASDYKYDYTCAYLLQAWSIPLLQSEAGKDWRLAYEEGTTDTLDETIGLALFEKLASFFALTGVTEEDAKRGYGATMNDLVSGKVAMIRQSTNNSSYYDAGLTDLVILPYFGQTAEDSWYFTTPSYAVAMNGSLKGTDKEDICLSIVRDLFSQGCMDIFAGEIQSFTAYNKGITFAVKDEFKNIIPYVESNHMYTYLAQDSFQAASRTAVQKMIAENASPEEALAAFNEAVVQTSEQQPAIAALDVSGSRAWTENGNAALSIIVNTLAQIADCDILLAPFTIHTSSVYAGDYSAEELGNLLFGGGLSFYTKKLTGAEVKTLAAAAVAGSGTAYDPISLSTLPGISGCTMVVSRTQDGGYQLDELLRDGKPIDEAAVFTFVYADNTTAMLRNVYHWDKAAHNGYDVAVDMNTEGLDIEAFEGFVYPSSHIADFWQQYFANGGKLAAATNYIRVK